MDRKACIDLVSRYGIAAIDLRGSLGLVAARIAKNEAERDSLREALRGLRINLVQDWMPIEFWERQNAIIDAALGEGEKP